MKSQHGSEASARPAGSVHPRIVTRHAEDAAFYWARRMEGSLVSQHDLRSLGRFEFLLQANLEGLRVAQHESSRFGARGEVVEEGSAGWAATYRRVQLWKTADESFVAGTLALENAGTGRPDGPDTTQARSPRLAMLEELACDQFDDAETSVATPIARGLASAASWLPWGTVSGPVLAWARSPEPVLRRSALSALALHRLPAGPALVEWLKDPHPLVRARALRAVGELGRADLEPELVVALAQAEAGAGRCHTAAVWSLGLLGHRIERAEFADNVMGVAPVDQVALWAAWAQTAPAADLQAAIEDALQDRERWRLALAVMRYSGDAHWLDTLIQIMEHQWSAAPVARFFIEPGSNLARLAADVFAHITGARVGEQLWRPAPEPDDDAEDAASDPRIPAARKQDPDDGLLWPEVDAVKRWWGDHRARFAHAGKRRYLAGLPLTAASAAQVLIDSAATQLQRHHAALHLRCADHSAQLFDVRAPLSQQRAHAAAMGLALP